MNRKRIILLGSLTLLLLASWVLYELLPVHSEQQKTISIDQGQGLIEVAEELEENSLIKNETFFIVYGKLMGYASNLKPGKHTVPGGSSYSEIYEELIISPMEKGVEVVIPEGFTIEQIAARLDAKGVTTSESFLKIAKKGEGLAHPLLAKIGDHKGVKYRLEGFLFPDTYFFKKGTPTKEVIVKMMNRFEEVSNELKLNEGKSLQDVVTLASIVEKEAVVPEERPIIAGVFKNRLEDDWKLQSCATVQYVLDKPKARLLYKDLEVESPYNTYLHEGLPPGPISNPGKASLKAAINAKDHDYFFFVVKGDGSGEHHFSETFKEHQKYTNHNGNW